jgi:hypothetical protein
MKAFVDTCICLLLPADTCVKPCFEECRLLGCHIVFIRSLRRLLVIANVVPSSPVLVTLMMDALSSSVTLVLRIATRRNIPEDAILHSHRRENFKFYGLRCS